MKILTQCLPFLVALVFSSGVTCTFNELYGKKVPNRVVQSRTFRPKFFGKSSYADDHFWHPASNAYFETDFAFRITNFEFQVREIPDPDKLSGTTGKAH